jgi:multicomponent Na+:H+ antiporter subunit C
MEILFAVMIGGLFSAGIYMMLQRAVVKLIIGLALLSHGANLLLFTVGGVIRGKVPLIQIGNTQPVGPTADPLPQALILTAIVISFAVLSYAMTLVYRTYQATGSENLDKLGEGE